MCGPSEDPLCHDGRVRQEVKGLRECPAALGIFQMDLKNICKFWSLIETYHLLVCNIINMMPYNGCSQMLHISLKTEKSFIAHPWRLLCVVGLEEYSAHAWRAATSGTARSSYLARVGSVILPTRVTFMRVTFHYNSMTRSHIIEMTHVFLPLLKSF